MAGGSMHRAAWLPLLLAGLCPSEIRGDGGGGGGGRPTKNITVYRVTPVNLTGIADRNTGDAAGDIFFTLYVAIAPVYCRTNPLDSICNITQSVLGDEHINVYRQSVIEVDAGFGVYNGCNPYANGTVECHPYVRGPVCWYNSTCGGRQPDGSYVGAIGPFCLNSTAADRAAEAKFQKSFRPLCSRSRCSCEDELTRAVGKWPCVFCRRDDGPPHKQTPLWKQINKFAQTLNGNWFSTRRGGECAEGERPGTGKCFWREVKLLKNANATCVRRNFLAAVARRNAGCYAGCAQPRNTSTPCYVECMLGTITGMGPQAAGSQAMSRQELLAPFERAFASSDESKGGCPDVPVGADELLGQA